MHKRILSLVVVAVFMLSILAGCGSAKTEEAQFSSNRADVKSGVNGNYGSADSYSADAAVAKETESSPQVEQKATAITGSGIATKSISNAILAQRKMIRTANVSVEVENFDKAYGQLKTIITGIGFIQESSIKKDKRYVDSKEILLTNGIIVIRVDKDKFEEVLDDVSGLGVVLDQNINTDDVTDKYFDTEARLRLLRFEEGRLEDYLKKQLDPDTIFKTESRLTDIRYEIESLTGTLKKWTDLVELSTITININEKNPVPSPAAVKEKTYWEKLQEQFSGSLGGMVKFLGEVLLFFAGALPVIILLVLLGWILFVIYRKYFGKTAKTTNKDDNSSIS